ncbi:hypothetical protein [Fusobacterium gastrosuis]|uniref:hypothetical protein n=1 Tax=Fusobacterium gastrosuis TaxID=1755100 RepID=UPI0029711556|nr:hypothetical protein [Fusobacteriaceae bacterium]MDY5714090.1 hypothetical protein [Fusobacterium gastrosuis]
MKSFYILSTLIVILIFLGILLINVLFMSKSVKIEKNKNEFMELTVVKRILYAIKLLVFSEIILIYIFFFDKLIQ